MRRAVVARRCAIAVLVGAAVAIAATAAETPARRRVATAEQRIARDGGGASAYTALASALAELARETSDPAYYARARVALDEALRRAPDDPAARQLAVWILLGQHDFARARESAELLRRRAPDDIAVYPLLVDAYVELGEYALAEEAAQRTLDLRPDYVPGLARAAYLRELFGDLDGSLQLLADCIERTPASEAEQHAWFWVHIAHVQRLMGRLDEAGRSAEAALDALPDYHYALATLSDVRADQGRLEEALALAQRHVEVAPHPENRVRVAQLLARLGRRAEAAAAFARFEAAARAESAGTDNANRELALYLADEGGDPEAALRVASLERARRRDVFTLEAHAWALHRNRRHAEARAEIEQALAVGVRDPRLFYHAGAIALAQGDEANGRRWLEAAAAQIPGSEWARLARAEIARVEQPDWRIALAIAAAAVSAVSLARLLGPGSASLAQRRRAERTQKQQRPGTA